MISTSTGSNNYDWTIPNNPSVNCKIKLTDSVSPNYVAISSVFSIANPAPPSVPLNVEISNNQLDGTITISWSASSGNPDGYYVYFATDPDFTDIIQLTTVPATQTSYTHPTQLINSQGYYYVRAYRN